MPRGGPRPNSGGARPGAGRKKPETVDYQGAMRAAFEARVTPERWQRVIDTAIEQAEQGNKDARAWLTPWVVGAEPKEVKHEVSGPGGGPIPTTVFDYGAAVAAIASGSGEDS